MAWPVRLAGGGLQKSITAQVDRTHAALRTSLRPPEVGLFGSYRVALTSGVIAAGIANGSGLWQFRWGSQEVVAIIRKLRMQAVVSTTAFTTVADCSFSVYRLSAFANMGVNNGGTSAGFLKAKSNAVSSRFNSSQFAQDATNNKSGTGGILILNTLALTGASGVTDASPLATVLGRVVTNAPAESIITPEPPPYLIDPAECPVIAPVELYQNEGLDLFVDAIAGTGTWRLTVEVCWDEVDPARYFGLYG
jgi:hypothetical protein